MVDWSGVLGSIFVILGCIFVFGYVKLFIFLAPITKLIGMAIDAIINQITGGIGGAMSMAGGGQAAPDSGKIEIGEMCCGMIGPWFQPLGIIFFLITGWILLFLDFTQFGMIIAIIMTIFGVVGVLLRKMPFLPPPEISFPLIDVPMMTHEYNSFWAIVTCMFFDLLILVLYPISATIGLIVGWIVFIANIVAIIAGLIYTSETWAPVAAEMSMEMAPEMGELLGEGGLEAMGEMGGEAAGELGGEAGGEMGDIQNVMDMANDARDMKDTLQPKQSAQASGEKETGETATAEPSNASVTLEGEIEAEEGEIKEEEEEAEANVKEIEAQEEILAQEPIDESDPNAVAKKQKQMAALGNSLAKAQTVVHDDIKEKRADIEKKRDEKARASMSGKDKFKHDLSGAAPPLILIVLTVAMFLVVLLFMLQISGNPIIAILFSAAFGIPMVFILKSNMSPGKKIACTLALVVVFGAFLILYAANPTINSAVDSTLLQSLPAKFAELRDYILALFWDLAAMVIPRNIAGVPVQNPMQFQSCYPFCTSPTGEDTMWRGLEITNIALIPTVVYDYQTFSLIVEFTNLGSVDASFYPPAEPTLKDVENCVVDISTGALIQTLLGDADAVYHCEDESILAMSPTITQYVAGGCREDRDDREGIWQSTGEGTGYIKKNVPCILEPQDTLRIVWYGIEIKEDNPALDLGMSQTPEIVIDIPYTYKPNTDLVGYMVVSSIEAQVASQEISKVERISNKISASYSPVGPLMLAMGTAEDQVIEHIPTLFMLQFANKGLGTVQDASDENVGVSRDDIRLYMPPDFKIMGYSSAARTSSTCDFYVDGIVSDLKTDPAWNKNWYPGPGFDDYYVLSPKESLQPLAQSFNPFENPVLSCVLYPPSEQALQELNTYMFKARVTDYGYLEKRSVFVQVIGTDVVVIPEAEMGCTGGECPNPSGGDEECLASNSIDRTYTWQCYNSVLASCSSQNKDKKRGTYQCVEENNRLIWIEVGTGRTKTQTLGECARGTDGHCRSVQTITLDDTLLGVSELEVCWKRGVDGRGSSYCSPINLPPGQTNFCDVTFQTLDSGGKATYTLIGEGTNASETPLWQCTTVSLENWISSVASVKGIVGSCKSDDPQCAWITDMKVTATGTPASESPGLECSPSECNLNDQICVADDSLSADSTLHCLKNELIACNADTMGTTSGSYDCLEEEGYWLWSETPQEEPFIPELCDEVLTGELSCLESGGEYWVKEDVLNYFYDVNGDCVPSDPPQYAGRGIEQCDCGCEAAECKGEGDVCRLVFVVDMCFDNDIYESYNILKYDSRCNCIVSGERENILKEDCGDGLCHNGKCKGALPGDYKCCYGSGGMSTAEWTDTDEIPAGWYCFDTGISAESVCGSCIDYCTGTLSGEVCTCF